MRINFGLAGLALLLSMALWILVINDQNPERIDIPDISIPVEITKVPSGLVVMSSIEPVRFKIRAPKDRWSGLRASSFRAYVDLSRAGPGMQAVPIIPESSDPQVRVMEVIPSTSSVRLEEIQERTVRVKTNLAGNVPFGYVYSTPKVDPEVVVVSGPASLVQTVETASVDIRLDGITVEVDASFHPVPLDSSGGTVRNVKLDPQTVKVRLPVQQQVSYKQVGVRGVTNGAVASGYWIDSVTVEPSSVTAVGDPKLLAGIEYLDTVALDVNGLSVSVSQDVRLVVPEGVSLTQQQTVRARVSISPLQTSQIISVAPRIVEVDPKLQLLGAPSAVSLTLKGPAPVLQRLRVENVGVSLDAAGLGEGSHSIKPSVSVPAGVSVVSVDPDPATIVLVQPRTPTPSPTPSPTPQPPPTATTTPTPGR